MALILVTGCARSGTSLTSQILQAHGCWLGKPNRVNRLFENIDIRERVLKPYLKSVGADPLGQKVLPATGHLPPHDGLAEQVERWLGVSEPRSYKDAKLTLVWPVWRAAFPDAKWVLVRRDKEKIVDSCARTDFMRAFDGRSGWRRWVEAHEERFAKMRQALDIIEVWPDEVIKTPESFAPVAWHCGLAFDPKTTRAAIKPDVWHG